MEVTYIVVQAGGKGSRMENLTRNKPKALVPVDNLPILFHLFKKYPHGRFLIIGDYKLDVLRRYLQAFAGVSYQLIDARGKPGTCGGIREACEQIPEDTPFMLIWSDLVLHSSPDIQSCPAGNYVGISKGFRCRWKYENGVFEQEESCEYGVAGLFLFREKDLLAKAPQSGEFVQWLSTQSIPFAPLALSGTAEYGLFSEYERSMAGSRCRPFNRITDQGDRIVKEAVTRQGEQLAARERAWYRTMEDKGFYGLPRIYSLEPLVLEKIDGRNIFECTGLSYGQKEQILKRIIGCLKDVHAAGDIPAEKESYRDAYIDKTLARLEKVKNLVPFAGDKTVVINGIACRNALFHMDELEKRLARYFPPRFQMIHGDCTFSNLMLRGDGSPVLIDPRGYFGTTELYGDPAYDWAKLYYSVAGDYDQFNLRRFSLDIGETGVSLSIESNGWKEMEDVFFSLLEDEVEREQIKLIHTVIWLSLTTYAWEDYDSICGAFYNGLRHMEDVL